MVITGDTAFQPQSELHIKCVLTFLTLLFGAQDKLGNFYLEKLYSDFFGIFNNEVMWEAVDTVAIT